MALRDRAPARQHPAGAQRRIPRRLVVRPGGGLRRPDPRVDPPARGARPPPRILRLAHAVEACAARAPRRHRAVLPEPWTLLARAIDAIRREAIRVASAGVADLA